MFTDENKTTSSTLTKVRQVVLSCLKKEAESPGGARVGAQAPLTNLSEKLNICRKFLDTDSEGNFFFEKSFSGAIIV